MTETKSISFLSIYYNDNGPTQFMGYRPQLIYTIFALYFVTKQRKLKQ